MYETFAMDARTVISMDLIVISVIVLVTMQNAIQHRKIMAARWWAASSILLFIGVLLLGPDQPVLPIFLQTFVLNTALLGQAMLITIGLANISKQPEPRAILGSLLILHLAIAEYFSIAVQQQSYRALSFSVILIVTLMMSIEILVKMWRSQKLAAIPLLITIMSLQVGVFLLYAFVKISTINEAPASGFSMGNLPPALIIAFLGFMLAQLLQAFALVMLTSGHIQRDLKYLAGHDQLTGAVTRNGFMELGQRAAQEAMRNNRGMAVMFLDLDHFKSVNDRYGHAAGDYVLQEFADRIRNQLRIGDSLCRWGGEEFAITLPATNQNGAILLGERLRAAIADHPFRLPGHDIAITVSIGICATDSAQPVPFDVMLKQADTALYTAKALGRNRAEFLSYDLPA